MANHRIFVTLAAASLAACSNQPTQAGGDASAAPQADGQTASAPAASPANSEAATIEARGLISADIARVIASYRNNKPSDFALSADFDRTWKRALGKGQLDFDPLCNCQDYDAAKFRHRLKTIDIDGDRATAKFDLDAGQGEWQAMRLTFAREHGDWLLDDIGSPNLPSLKRDMAKAAAGSYGMEFEQ